MKPKQLTFVREYRGYSQTELSAQIKGLSQSNLSKFEKGVGSLSDEVKQRIVDFLGFPKEFYDFTISNNVENAHYRKKAGMTKKEKEQIERSNKLVGYIIDQMSDSIDFPKFALKVFDLEEGYTPSSVARFTRKRMGINQGGVSDICTILERYGIIIVERYFDTEKFDGVSFFTDNGFPVIIINKGFSNDRKRLTIAHELGHILMHLSPDFAFTEARDRVESREKEAKEFAAEFLMPSEEIRPSLLGLKFSYLSRLKEYWLTSMASIVYRARELGCIDGNKYKNLNIDLSRFGYKKHEPIEVGIDTPLSFYTANKLFHDVLSYNLSDMAKAFCLPVDVIQDLCTETPRLRIATRR